MKLVNILLALVVVAVVILAAQGQVDYALLVFIMALTLLSCANGASAVHAAEQTYTMLGRVMGACAEEDPHDISEEDEEEIRQVIEDADVLKFHGKELQRLKTCALCDGDIVPIIKPGSPDPWAWDTESRFACYEYDYDPQPVPHKEAVFICKKCSFVQQRSLEDFAVKTEEVPLKEATS